MLSPHKIQACLITCLSLIMAGTFSVLSAFVPPHPLFVNPPEFKASRPSELFGPRSENKDRPLPQNVLVLRVQFSDKAFQSTPAYPDSLAHDRAYFERWMLQLGDFYLNASHNAYQFNYDVIDAVFTMPNTMAYYGDDTSELNDARSALMLQELIQMADDTIDYNDYDAIVVFHAGPGQESDINDIRTGELWSNFFSRSDMQYYLDPENDAFPGIATNDNKYIREIVLIAESEFQDYFPVPPDPNSSVYLFSIYGVLCHQFGHAVGLPTLFDNYSANGASQGIGNWGLMGTGLWNGGGYVPAQLDAWCRYYLGWEEAQVITSDLEDIPVDYFLNNSPTAMRLYKIPISEKEYFLVENRQQNPDNSLDPYTNQPSYTFNLLDPSEQDYYDPPYELLPFFNFMENRYKGCEWDFFLPGLGGPLLPGESVPTDGSGLVIWHIDENIIEANFDPDFESDHVNYDASHKGVDVEEADGIQHLDTAVFDYYKYGSPYDTFREGNNSYFGNNTLDGNLHLPTAESYYGGIPLEIYNIGTTGAQMTFSVRFSWKLDTGYVGENNLDACSVDTDLDGRNEIFYPMDDGNLYLWKNEELAAGFPISAPGKIKSYAWDGDAFYLTLAMGNDPDLPILNLRKLQDGLLSSIFTIPNITWATPIMSVGNYLIAGVRNQTNSNYAIWTINKETEEISASQDISDSLCTNLVWFRDKLYTVTKSTVDGSYNLHITMPDYSSENVYPLQIASDSTIVALSIAPISPASEGEILIQTPYSVYLTDLTGQLKEGYPVSLPFVSYSQITITDSDKNGTLDYLVSGENSFAVYDYAGKNMLTNFSGFALTDTLGITSGVLAGDYDSDSKTEYIGAFSRNRLAIYEDNLRLKNGFPVSFFDRSRNLPFIHTASDSAVYAWLATDNGRIFRTPLSSNAPEGIDPHWFCKYGNLERTSSRELGELENQYETNSLFVPGETYVFPNPVRSIYEQKITFHIMTSRDAIVEVSVFDIAGNLLYRKKVECQAYLRNRELVEFQVDNLSSGVYIAVLKSGNDVRRIKFAVEK
jgi:M6 family metalloprotease-like protein